MAYFLDVAILIGDAELAKCLAQHCASFPRSRWRYQEFVKISQHDGTVSAMDIQEQDVLMAALAASVALETLQADDLSVVEAVVLLGDEAKFLLERSGGRERLRRSAHRESVRRAAGRAGVALFQSLLGLGAIAASSCGEFGVGRSSLAQVLEGREAELPFLGHWLEESGHGGHQDAQSPQPVVYRVQAESAKHREDDGAADSQGRSGILECSMNKRAATITELANLSQDGPAEYTVAQGVCFIKPSEDPQSGKILKAKRPVGSKIYTTGTTWKGPQGGLWAEVDVARSPGEMGWVLVSGPGFGLRGPCLIDPEANDGASQMIHIRWLKDPPIFNCMMPKAATVGDLVDTFCSRTGLNRKETILTKGLPRKAPNGTGALLPVDYTDPKDVLFREMTIEEAQIRDTLNLVYVGHFDEDYNPS
eukprot:s87_g28.t2